MLLSLFFHLSSCIIRRPWGPPVSLPYPYPMSSILLCISAIIWWFLYFCKKEYKKISKISMMKFFRKWSCNTSWLTRQFFQFIIDSSDESGRSLLSSLWFLSPSTWDPFRLWPTPPLPNSKNTEKRKIVIWKFANSLSYRFDRFYRLWKKSLVEKYSTIEQFSLFSRIFQSDVCFLVLHEKRKSRPSPLNFQIFL